MISTSNRQRGLNQVYRTTLANILVTHSPLRYGPDCVNKSMRYLICMRYSELHGQSCMVRTAISVSALQKSMSSDDI